MHQVHGTCREWHAKRLARRLLNAGTVENLEESFLQRLKAQCGAQFTQKMEGMCSDLKIARSKQEEFLQWLSNKPVCRCFPLFSMQGGAGAPLLSFVLNAGRGRCAAASLCSQ